jgi:dTDP-glucose 4,6-dehydratase
MRILVTGGAGFIGSNFVRMALDRLPDAEVNVLDALTYAGNLENFDGGLRDDPRFSFWYGNVTNADLVHDLVGGSEVVVHFAAESHVARSIYDNSLFFTTDVLGTQTMANAVAKAESVRLFVHVSTSEVYGTALLEPMSEEHPLNPLSPYASAKTGADRLVYSYCATYGIPAVIVRPFNNFGPYQHLEKVVPRFVCSALAGEPLTVHGTGEAMRDWLFVDDTCRGLLALVEQAGCERAGADAAAPGPAAPGCADSVCAVYNLGTGRAISVQQIAELVCDMTGRPRDLIRHIGDRPGQVGKHVADASRFGAAFGWRPQVEFEDGLERTVAWYADHESWWRRLEWMKHVPVRTQSGSVEFH